MAELATCPVLGADGELMLFQRFLQGVRLGFCGKDPQQAGYEEYHLFHRRMIAYHTNIQFFTQMNNKKVRPRYRPDFVLSVSNGYACFA